MPLSKKDTMAAIRLVLLFLVALPFAACASTDVAEKKEQASKPMQRRAVPALADRPVTPPPSAPSVPMPAVPQTAVPSGPAPVTGCDPGGCWSGGTRYNGGAGGTYLDKGGRLCQSNGAFMQCF